MALSPVAYAYPPTPAIAMATLGGHALPPSHAEAASRGPLPVMRLAARTVLTIPPGAGRHRVTIGGAR